MTTPLYTFFQKSNTQIRDDFLRTVANGLRQIGISNPNIAPGSDWYIIATALGNELAVVQANAVVVADQCMPDTATGAFLDRWLNLNGLSRNAATNSFGNITITVSASSTLIVTGQQLTDSVGQLYQVTVGGSYGNGAQVPVESISTGAGTNHANGDVLTWITAPAYSSPTVVVGIPGGSDGLEGGADSEVGFDEPPRGRLLARLQDPPKGGNSSDIAAWSGQSTADVQATFVYPALLGPSTVFFVVVGAPTTTLPLTSTSKNRNLPTALVTGTILPFVQGNLPEHALCVGASAVNISTDVAILLSLPAAPTAAPPGPGGGWLDGTPWPSSVSGTTPVSVTAFVNSTLFTVNATSAPQDGVSHIAWISPNNWQLYTATVLSHSGSSGAYQITIDTPMPGIGIGNFIFPQSVNQANYMAALFSAFQTMGPGEWTGSSTTAFKRAFRHPLPSLTYPSALGPVQLKQIIDSGPEVSNATYIFTGDNTVPTSFTAPSVPSTITLDPVTQLLTSTAPGVLVPRNLAFYAA